MKKQILRLACLVLILVLTAAALVGCEGDEGDGITLIKNGKAQFKVVIASGAGSDARRAANTFVDRLRELGVDVGDSVIDTDVVEMVDCEIIVGTGVKNRPDECVVSEDTIGENGYVIKAVGKRIVIAGGTSAGTKAALERFTETHLGISDETEALSSTVTVSATLLDEFISSNSVTAFEINGKSISDFVIAFDYGKDQNVARACPSPTSLRDTVKDITGVELEVQDLANTTYKQNRIIMRLTDKAGLFGFRVYVNGNDLIIECSYYNLFTKAFDAFVESEIANKNGTVTIDKDYLYTYDVTTVKYSDFGAVGDGKTNDFDALKKTHEFANKGGQKVVADKGAHYYIGRTYGETIPIMTHTDFGDATFTIDDTVEGVYADRRVAIFTVMKDPDNEEMLDEAEIKQLAGTDDPQILRTYDKSGKLISGKIPWLASKLTSGAMLVLQNSNHKDYIRFGANRNEGESRSEMIIVDSQGNIDSTTPVTFDFEDITEITIIYTDDVPITLRGGQFYNICSLDKGTDESDDDPSWYFKRGIDVLRSNTTITNLDHKMKNEPVRYVNGEDKFGLSYPYNGFIIHSYTYNSKVISCDLTGHKTYLMDKSETTGASRVSMGSYDISVEHSIGSYFECVTQSEVPIDDGAYWGMMTSNYSRQITFKSCSISRFDAHCGFWNADLIDCEFGQYINVIGGGQLNIIRCRRIVGKDFIQLRGDYGATFEGDVLIEDCVFDSCKTYNSEHGQTLDLNTHNNEAYVFNATVTNGTYGTGQFAADYYTWDFGYKCYLPGTIILDNFVSKAVKTYIFNQINDEHFISQQNGDEIYEPTKQIIFRNMTQAQIDALPNCKASNQTSIVAAFKRTKEAS